MFAIFDIESTENHRLETLSTLSAVEGHEH